MGEAANSLCQEQPLFISGGKMNDLACEFLRTDFGHEVYDGWYLEHASYNFEAPELVKKTLPFL